MADQPHREIPGQPSRKKLIIEVLVFLFFLILLAEIEGLFFLVKPGRLSEPAFLGVALLFIIKLLALTALIFFFAWQNGEPLARFGLNFKNGWRDVGLGILLFFPLMLIVWFGMQLTYLVHLVFPGLLKEISHIPQILIPQKGEILLAFILVCVVAITEEIIFRGYLLQRFLAILGNATAAIFLSSALFALGYVYKTFLGVVVIGFPGVVAMFFVGIFYAFLFLRRQSLVAPIMLHLLQDFILVLIPIINLIS